MTRESSPPPGTGPSTASQRIWNRLKRFHAEQVVWVCCWLSLASTGLMLWSVLDPTPLPVLVSMTVGQLVGTLALTAFVVAVLLDMLGARRARRERESGAPENPGKGY